TEMATGEGKGTLEGDTIVNDFDFLHIINWKKAEEVVEAGKYEMKNGVRYITLETAIDEGLLYFAPEPRNPHGVDVAPNGDQIVVSGKLDPTITVYSFEKIKKAIDSGDFDGTDPFGVPILKFDSVIEGQVEVGGGPLHSQFDDKGFVYTSLFVESAVAKTSLDTLEMVEKIPIHYNVGHLVTAEGDTVSPDGKYLVSLNKWSVDRFPVVGTLKPQNFQLVDLTTPTMQLLTDMPIGFGEPHYTQMIKADKLTSRIEVYEPGTDPLTMEHSEWATESGEEKIVRDGNDLHVYMSAMRSHFTPDVVRAKKGDQVHFHVTNIETAPDATHGFAIPGYNKQISLDPGETVTVNFKATRSGSFAFYCTEFCSALHLEMQGWLLVEP
ncbi:MAG: cupredoxin domain-containing protein, partial [Actinomycetota bacterium]